MVDVLSENGWVTERLPGGMDEGVAFVAGTVRRPIRAWSRSVHDLLRHLQTRGFYAAPRFLGVDAQGREVLTYLEGETVGDTVPWPAWTHCDQALVDIGHWLRDYHRAVADYVPRSDAVWREGRAWQPGLIVGHGDPAPYNAVWRGGGLVGLIDWDNAGPVLVEDDLAWVAFSWTPLHAPSVVMREGFTALSTRPERLLRLLDAYGWTGSLDEVVARIEARLLTQIATMRATALAGDPAYQRMLDRGQDRLLEIAREQLTWLWSSRRSAAVDPPPSSDLTQERRASGRPREGSAGSDVRPATA